MAKTLNPHATPAPAAPSSSSGEPPRRHVLVAAMAGIVGLIVGLFPVGAGMLVFLDPILKRKKSGGEGTGKPRIRVSSLAAIPEDGTPVQVPVIADLTDAWMRDPNQPVGAVYLRRNGNNIECLNAICPHAGCFVAYMADRKVFQCPCHTSAFDLNGKRLSEKSPSPRDMDTLNVDPDMLLTASEVWVEYVNYYPGKPNKEEKP
ncbi:MAG: ubiquinol-cytochrome c reductase iron-sulfur subunit [Pirellulaceae bacterium]